MTYWTIAAIFGLPIIFAMIVLAILFRSERRLAKKSMKTTRMPRL